jgi:hypothetical protein
MQAEHALDQRPSSCLATSAFCFASSRPFSPLYGGGAAVALWPDAGPLEHPPAGGRGTIELFDAVVAEPSDRHDNTWWDAGCVTQPTPSMATYPPSRLHQRRV